MKKYWIYLFAFLYTSLMFSQITWNENIGFTVTGNHVEGQGGIISKLLSTNTLEPTGEDGWVEISNFTIPPSNPNNPFVLIKHSVGLLPIANLASLDWATGYYFRILGSPGSLTLYAYNHSTNLGSTPFNPQTDTARIERVGNTIYFKINGTTVFQTAETLLAQTSYKIIVSTTQPTGHTITSSLTIGSSSGSGGNSGGGSTSGTAGEKSMDHNWIASKTFDIDGNITSDGVSYFDELGKGIQTQNIDVKTGKIWASQTIYDTQGKPALQTLSAPINTTGSFLYKTNFIQKSNGTAYTKADFETNPENPSTVGNQPNTLGWYYSENNDSEPYQDVTNYPFSRTIYSNLNPGTALKTIGGNKVTINGQSQWINGFNYTMPAAQELYYAFGNDYFDGLTTGNGKELITKFLKSVTIDVHGEETIVFTDAEGKTLAAARSGGNTKYEVISVIGEQGYVDVHIPKGIVNNDIHLLASSTPYTIYNLRTEQIVSPSQITGGNIYRISSSPQQGERTKVWIRNNQLFSLNGAKGIRYKVNYTDFTLNYYDKAGRLIKTVQPLGFDESGLNSAIGSSAPNHSMKSSFVYNSANELLETSSPDEGTAKFLYRDDGQIRFSQNSKQVENNELSYTNYDNLGRPVESGVYNGPLNFNTNVRKDITFANLTRVQTSGDEIKKIGYNNWNSGLATVNKISGDGYVWWQFLDTDKNAMVGLSGNNTNANYNTIQFAIYGKSGKIFVYENGINRGEMETYKATDTFKVERIRNTIYYKKNNIIFYQSSLFSSGDLLGDVSLYSAEVSINNFYLGGSSVYSPSRISPYEKMVNISEILNRLIKTGGTNGSYDAGLSTLEYIAGDGYMEWVMPETTGYLSVGLSPVKLSNHWGMTKYNILFRPNNGGRFDIKEYSGTPVYNQPFNAGDIFRIERVGTTIYYKRNGITFHTSSMQSIDEELVGDIGMRDMNSTIQNLRIVGGTKQFKDRTTNILTLGKKIRKTSLTGWNSGFSSESKIQGDGYVEWIAGNRGKALMLGLSDSDTNVHYNTIDYAFYMYHSGSLMVYESGIYKGSIAGGYKAGDVLRVERSGGTIKYYKNGTVVFTSATTTTAPLLIDGSFLYYNSKITGLKFYDLTTSSFPVEPTENIDPQYCKEQLFTVYGQADIAGLHAALNAEGIATNHYTTQNFVAGNVAKTYTAKPNTTTTWYSYDIYGRLQWLVQKIDGLGTKTIDYEYDPIKGNVTKVSYQKYKPSETFIHRYTYNQVNELTQVETSLDAINFTNQAKYYYYETGALKRIELADKLQGIDYIYNLAGQLKAINHPSRTTNLDPGHDSYATNQFNNDVFGMALDYYNGDYMRTNTPTEIKTSPSGTNQYNGNIKAIRWSSQAISNGAQYGQTFTYNNKNWLQEANFGTAINNGTISVGTDYKVTHLTYDKNGNLQTLQRNKQTQNGSNAMDNFTYHYKTGTNQLSYIDDTATSAVPVDDLKDQAPNNYHYNSIGQLDLNTSENIEYIYNASGLVTDVKKNGQSLVSFYYNDRGQRVHKIDFINEQHTYYVRDVSGSVMAIYNNSTLAELPIYGASRLGIFSKSTYRSKYEITDHLGNVRAVIERSQAKTFPPQVSVNGSTDYYPFGMAMPGRQIVNGQPYRYAFQGQEKDPETGKEAFELRLWDGRIGRWLSPDPYRAGASPYWGMDNNPISSIDPDGGCPNPPCWEDNDTYNAGSLSEVVVVAPGNGQMTSEVNSQYDYGGTFAQWQRQFGYEGIDYNNALALWKSQDNGAWERQVARWDQQAREQRVLDKLTFFTSYFVAIEDVVEVLPASEAASIIFRTTKTTVPVLAKGTTNIIVKKTVSEVTNAVQQNFKRFLKKLPANARSSAQILKTKNGFAFTGVSPGEVPGSKAIYTKFVNENGITTKYLKTTIDPQGNIVHIKQKF